MTVSEKKNLILRVEFLTGRCVAAGVANRDEPEWPPHPGRLFMAMAAACFERDEDEKEVAALNWLSEQPAPELYWTYASQRTVVKNYVAVNDEQTFDKNKKPAFLQSVPGLPRSKQERTYPTAIPECPVFFLCWNNFRGDDHEPENHLEAIREVCQHVIRLGHSSSLVMVTVEDELPDLTSMGDYKRYRANDEAGSDISGADDVQLRVAGRGEFQRLKTYAKMEQIERFAELKHQIDHSTGKAKKAAKDSYESMFGAPYKASHRAPQPSPARISRFQNYRLVETGQAEEVANDYFNSQLMIFQKLDGPALGIQSTLQLTNVFRRTLMRMIGENIPGWISGHELDGSPTQAPHAAYLPLPYAGFKYADGHIMGIAMALPKAIDREERGRYLRKLVVDEEGVSTSFKLTLGRLGEVAFKLAEDTALTAKTLQNQNWTDPSHHWATVSPLVLDRFPKTDRMKDRTSWTREVCEIIAGSCQHAGLPLPKYVDISTTAWHPGVPRAYTKKRPLKSKAHAGIQETSLGDGFPAHACTTR